MTGARLRRAPALLALAAGSIGVVTVASLLSWLALLAGAHATHTCAPGVDHPDVPTAVRPTFAAAADRHRLGARGSAILAAIAATESDFGRNMGPSSAGAVGYMQFMPDTWHKYGTDANGDGRADPEDPADAITSAARYLHASGAPGNWRRAIYAYNHSAAYVATVLAKADRYANAEAAPATACDASVAQVTGDLSVRRVSGRGALVPIPGFPGERIDERILPDLLYLVEAYHLTVTAAYAPAGHKAAGEHPLGLGVDLVPGPGRTWDDVDRLARWAEPTQNNPRPPFRWVGYDGDGDHGRGDHLHLSWNHAPTPPGEPPAAWVLVFT